MLIFCPRLAHHTAGYQQSDACLAILNKKSITKFMESGFWLGTDVLLFSTDASLTGVSTGTLVRDQHIINSLYWFGIFLHLVL